MCQNDELKTSIKSLESEKEGLLEGRKELEVGLKLLYENNGKLEEQLVNYHSLSKTVVAKEDEIREMRTKCEQLLEEKEKFNKETEE